MNARLILRVLGEGAVAGLMEGKRQSMSGGGMKGLMQKFTVVWRPMCLGLA